jgi:hypothetical protein
MEFTELVNSHLSGSTICHVLRTNLHIPSLEDRRRAILPTIMIHDDVSKGSLPNNRPTTAAAPRGEARRGEAFAHRESGRRCEKSDTGRS